MKKIIALLMAATMVLSSAACGTTPDEDRESPKDNLDLDWTKGADASGGNVTLRVATWRKYDKDYYEEIARRFEEKYDWIDVQIEITPDANSYYSNLQADLASGVAPDVFDSHPTEKLIVYSEEGMIAPQTDFDYMKNYKEEAKKITTLSGENYGYMNAYNYFGFIYNVDIFEKEGVSVPTTPDEFISVVNKLKAAGYGGAVVAGTTFGAGAMGDAAYLVSLGSEGYDALRQGIDDGSVTDISTVKGVPEALDTLSTYIQNDVFYNAWEAISYEAGISLFAQEKSAIMYSGSYMFGEGDHFEDMNVGFFPFPTYANTKTTLAEGAQTTVINAASANLGAAKLWVEHLASPEIAQYYCTQAEMMSTIEGVTVESDTLDMINRYVDGYAIKTLVEPENSEYWATGFAKILEGVVLEGQDWKELVKFYRSKLEEYDLASFKD